MKPCRLTVHGARELLDRREISSEELTLSVLDRVESSERSIGAYISLDPQGALHAAREADRAMARGQAGPLTGIPMAVKDLICTKGIRTTCASKILEDFVPPYDATVITKLKKAGAVILGKTNMDEFAMGSSTESSAFKTTRNPWNLERIPGGSSGGSAAAVAADMCIAALGSDTGGSIRQPASHCGVVGLKPTYGRVSRFGLVAFASSLDQIGPITKDVRDTALVLNTIAGYDPRDSTSVHADVPDYTASLDSDLQGMIVGYPIEYQSADGVHPDVAQTIQQAIAALEALGAESREVSLPHTAYAVAAYYIVAPAEASSNLARYDGVKYGLRTEDVHDLRDMYLTTRSHGFGPEVQRRIIIGTYALSAGYYDAYYRKASQVRTLIMEDFKKAFESCNVIICPVAPTPAFKLGEKLDDPLTMYLSDIFTLSANLAGIPGISVPGGLCRDGLPIGVQILGNHLAEEKMLTVANHLEQAIGFEPGKPVL
ncbi:Asp-tRNA(Asn)/Glu-tRNA(Gln) amidotransferase subunit GatA [Thermodesulfobacteriota bacterium]